ncbi:MAG: ATP-binding cassette domain-containing protein, partial [Oricola sp.]
GDPAHEAAHQLAHTVHLDHVQHMLVGELAYGQQRQLEIGLALAGAPRFILLDEPAAGLSSSERRELIQILRALPAHIGYAIIEHDLDVALRVAETVTVMNDGHIFKEGTPDEIESDPDVQRIYLGSRR